MADDALTAEEFATWLMPSYALGRVNQALDEMSSAIEVIVRRLEAGLILAAAKNSSWELDGRQADPTAVIVILPRYWSALTIADRKRDLWTTAQVRFQFDSDTSSFISLGFVGAPNPYRGPSRVVIDYFGIRFKPSDVADCLGTLPPGRMAVEAPEPPTASSPSPPVVASPAPNKGGRPPKEWWEDLWIEMFRRIHNGDFKPKNQAELENAMHDWLAEHSQAGSVQTVRAAARKLFRVLKD